jgi:DNA anti-recombination protein RmuC
MVSPENFSESMKTPNTAVDAVDMEKVRAAVANMNKKTVNEKKPMTDSARKRKYLSNKKSQLKKFSELPEKYQTEIARQREVKKILREEYRKKREELHTGKLGEKNLTTERDQRIREIKESLMNFDINE